MAGEDNTIAVEIKAIIKDLIAPLKQAGDAVNQTTQQMNGAFGKLQDTFHGIGKAFAAVTAIAAGGALFKHAIDATVQWNMDAGRLSRTLGVTTQEASYLKVALHTLGIDSDTYTNATKMMIRQINSGGEGFKKLGVETKDANGHLKPTTTLMTEVIEKIAGLKKGIDQQAAGMAIYGRGWGEASKLLRLTQERMAEAKKEAEELHLVVGPEGVAKTREYQEGLRKLGLIKESLMVQVGNALMPVLIKLGAWLGKTGPAMAEGMAYAIKGLMTVFYALKGVIETVATVVMALFMTIWNGLSTVADVMNKVVHGDFKGAWESAKIGAKSIGAEWAAAADGITSSWKEAAGAMKDIWTDKPAAAAKAEDKGGRFDPEKGNDKSEDRLRAWKLGLEEMKGAEANWFNWSKGRELEYWQDILATHKLSQKEKVAVLTEVNKIRRELGKEEHEAEEARAKEALEANRNNWSERLRLAQEFVFREIAVHGAGSKEVAAADAQLAKIEREIDAERGRIRMNRANSTRDLALKEIEWQAELVNAQAEMGEISRGQELEQLKAFEKQKLDLQLATIQAAREAENLSAEERENLRLKELELRKAYDIKIREMGLDAAKKKAIEAESAFEPLTSAFREAMGGMLAGTKSFGDGIRTIWQGVGKMIDKIILDMVTSWIGAELKKFAISSMLKVKELILHQTTSTAKVATTIGAAGAEITAAGAVAGANAAATAAQTPGIGWMIAIPAGLAVLAAVLGLKGSIGSAAGGWHTVPQDQMAMLHKDEQVLPARYAEGLRNMIEGGGAQQTEQHVHHWNVQTVDARGVERFLRDNNAAVGKAGSDFARNFGGRR